MQRAICNCHRKGHMLQRDQLACALTALFRVTGLAAIMLAACTTDPIPMIDDGGQPLVESRWEVTGTAEVNRLDFVESQCDVERTEAEAVTSLYVATPDQSLRVTGLVTGRDGGVPRGNACRVHLTTGDVDVVLPCVSTMAALDECQLSEIALSPSGFLGPTVFLRVLCRGDGWTLSAPDHEDIPAGIRVGGCSGLTPEMEEQ